VRIGLLGATYDDTPRASSPEDLKFLPTVATTTDAAQALRREDADFVVAVVHASREQDYAIFATRAVDLLLSGHDHDLFIEFDGRNAMVESSHDAHYVTAIDVAIDVRQEGGRRIVAWWPQFRIIDTATVVPDPEVAVLVAKFEEELGKELDLPIVTTTVALDSHPATVRTNEAAIDNLVADAMRVSTHAEAAVTNGGGIRGSKLYSPGSVLTAGDVLVALPFDNRVIVIDITGAELVRALENGFSQLPNAGGRFPQVSGLTIEADASRPAGGRAARRKPNLPDSDQRLHEARRRRLQHVPRRKAAALAIRCAAPFSRGDRLSQAIGYRAHRRRWTDRAEVNYRRISALAARLR
jgi:5'-nucleotidase / UDP-sugar diphosphatase